MKTVTITVPDDTVVSVVPSTPNPNTVTLPAPAVTPAVKPLPGQSATAAAAGYVNPTVAPTAPPPVQHQSASILETIFDMAMQTRNGEQYNGKLQSRISALGKEDLAFSYPNADALAAAAVSYNGHVLLIMPDRSIRAIKDHHTYPFPIDYFVMVPSGAVERCDQYGRVNEELRNAKAAVSEPLPYYGSIDLLMAGLLNIGFQYAVKVGNETVWTGFGPAVNYRLNADGSVARSN